MQILLTRGAYDRLLPMVAEALELYLSAKREWSVGGVRVTFKSEQELARFKELTQ